MYLTGLASTLRTTGLSVHEVPGWQGRGHGGMTSTETIVCHHTAGPRHPQGTPSLDTVVRGRPGLSGPLAHLYLSPTGAWYVVAAGLCYHAGVVSQASYSNSHAIGIEAEASGVDAWPAAQYASYVRGVAALRTHYGVPTSRCLGHKEVAFPRGRKPDPNFDMSSFRRSVAAAGTGRGTPAPSSDLSSDDRTWISDTLASAVKTAAAGVWAAERNRT